MPVVRNEVFVSYSHADEKWKDRLLMHLAPLIREGNIHVWHDGLIQTGAKWESEIEQALARARIAVLLATPEFLASPFITSKEMPKILAGSADGGLTIFWISVKSCLYDETPLREYQAMNDPKRPLASFSRSQNKIDSELVRIAKEIRDRLAPTSAPEIRDERRAADTRPRGSAGPHLSYGTWTLTKAIDDQGNDWSSSALSFTGQEETPDGLLVRGTFTWRLNYELVGTEEFTGHYVAATRQLFFVGSAVTDIPNLDTKVLAVGSYSAVLSPDERTLIDGRWGVTQLKDEAGVAGRWEAFR
jgi:hypothetical protein